MPWDPDQYLAFADERALPFHHLVAAVAHLRPARVLDIGCGPGALTTTLLERWPAAEIHGIDSSEEMIELARRRAVTDRLRFELADVVDWTPEKPLDLVLSNACFHWIEDHHRLLDHLMTLMSPTSTLAFQVPANHDRPSHTILAELCISDRWSGTLRDAYQVHVESPAWYIRELDRRQFSTTVWQTTYLHRLTGDDAVLEWVKGTTLRPILDRLDHEQTDTFLSEYGGLLRKAYPSSDGITVFPFTRMFVVASR